MVYITILDWRNISKNPSIWPCTGPHGLGRFRTKERIMASFAHVEHPSQHGELFAGVVKAIAASVRRTLQRWAKAHRQAVQDRMFWELALTDPRVMAELRAINDHAEQAARS
jgi:hypothetical protein